MIFEVRWTAEARDELAEVWLAHPDQRGVTAAAYAVESKLSRNPEGHGESREADDRRIMFESPLVVIYRIDAANRRVIISRVRQY